MPTIGELVIDIKASTASIQTDMTKLQGTMASSSAAIVSSLNKIVDVMIIDIGQRAVRALAGMVERSVEAADRIGRLSIQTGLSTDSLSKYGYAAKMADVDIQTFSAGMSRLSFKLEEAATTNKKLRDEFTRFGVDPKKIRDPEQALIALNESFNRFYQGDKARVIAASIELFSRAGFRLLPFLTMAPEQVRALAVEFEQMAGPAFGDTITAGEALHENFKRLDTMFELIGMRLMREVAPAIKAASDYLLNMAKDAALIEPVIKGIAEAINFLIGNLANFMMHVEKTIAEVKLLKAVWEEGQARGIQPELALGAAEEAAGGARVPAYVPGKETAAWEQYQKDIAAADDRYNKFLENQKKGLDSMLANVKGVGGTSEDVATKTVSAVTQIIKKLDEEAATYKMVATQVQLLKAIEAGASEAQLDHIVAQIAHLDELQGIYDDMARRTRAGVAPYGPLEPAAMNQLLGITQQMIPATDKLDESAYRARETMFDFYKGALTWEEKWQLQTEEIVELWRLYPELGDMAAKAIEAQNAAWDEHNKKTSILVAVQRDISQGFADALFGADSFGDAMQRLLLRIAEVIFQVKVLDPLLNRLFGIQSPGAGGGGGGGLFGVIGGFFGGLLGLQGGGSFRAGQPFLAGEAGPEIVYPGISGTVIPNHALGGVVYNIDARGADPTVEFRIRRALRESEQRSVARSVSTTREIGLRNIT